MSIDERTAEADRLALIGHEVALDRYSKVYDKETVCPIELVGLLAVQNHAILAYLHAVQLRLMAWDRATEDAIRKEHE